MPPAPAAAPPDSQYRQAPRFPARRLAAIAAPLLLILSFALLTGCKRGSRSTSQEYLYINAPQVNVRDRLSSIYNKVATLGNGDRVEVLERQKRFLRVRTSAGQEGWIEQRYLVGPDVFAGFQQLEKNNAGAPVLAHGATRAELNIHLAPARDAEHLFQLEEGAKVEILQRGVGEKVSGPRPMPPRASPPSKPGAALAPKPGNHPPPAGGAVVPANTAGNQTQPKAGAVATPPPPEVPKIYEDWWLVRDAQHHTGWVLARMIDLDVPMDIAQYSEGQRIVSFAVLNQVQDEDKKVAQYLVLLTEPKDGLPFDFNQFRIFTWNLRRHRYETAYRERNIFGQFPVKSGFEDFPKEGNLPYFVIREQDDNGQVAEKKYKLNGPIVRRVLSPEEEAAKTAANPPRTATAKAAAMSRLKPGAHPTGSGKRRHHKQR